jgi:hypothetical protein
MKADGSQRVERCVSKALYMYDFTFVRMYVYVCVCMYIYVYPLCMHVVCLIDVHQCGTVQTTW